MDLDGLKGTWQERVEPDADIGREDLMRDVLTRLDRLEHNLRSRDLREAAVGLGLMALFGWVAVTVDPLIARIGAWVIVAGCAFMILWSHRPAYRGRRRPSDVASDLPMVQFCRREMDFLDAQIHLLRSVWWWYIGPTFLGVQLFIYGSGHYTVFSGIMPVIVAVAVYWLNLQAAKHELMPLRAELERCLRELNGGR
jgi:hypothetical protein